KATTAFPLGARLKGAVLIDPVSFKLAGEAFAFACPPGPQIIEAIGVIDLGGGSRLHRLYLTDDAFLQIPTTGPSDTDRNVGDVSLFVYVDTINPANQGAFRRWVEPGSLLGAATYTMGNREYRRVWGEGSDPGWAPPVPFDEDVYKSSASTKEYDLSLYSMLYERTVDLADRNELLLVAAEDSGPNEYCVSIALGVPLTLADFEIT
ncbi:MAG TPA: DUF2491 family protein, partial [Dokdonella sp.]